VPYLSVSAVVIHYEEALYQVYTPLPYLTLTLTLRPSLVASLFGWCLTELSTQYLIGYHAMSS